MGAIDWLLLGLIALAAAFALRKTLRSKGSCAGCSGNCTACGQSCTCGKTGKAPPEG